MERATNANVDTGQYILRVADEIARGKLILWDSDDPTLVCSEWLEMHAVRRVASKTPSQFPQAWATSCSSSHALASSLPPSSCIELQHSSY